ncbi:putative oligosaccharyl transferase subunit [Trypanosoma cruzi]|uniref:Putative oligosaccharyl transferase subunit n=1 Tax=Trypanosoma cruzi TaxID=5693 RepID=A0A2V2WPX5_TRYCR|nr:putative oligosaccharyl transferase subunit [Trypanosoma cruzi]
MKSPHMARIGNSVYRDICPGDDPLCSNFGFEDQRPKSSHADDADVVAVQPACLWGAPQPGDRQYVSGLPTGRANGLVKIYKVMNVSAGEQGVGGGTRRTASATRQGRGCALGSTRQRRRSRRCWRGASTTASWRTSTAANETTRTTVRTCVRSPQ